MISPAISACSGERALALESDSKRSRIVETVTDRGRWTSLSSRVIFSHPAMSSRFNEVERLNLRRASSGGASGVGASGVGVSVASPPFLEPVFAFLLPPFFPSSLLGLFFPASLPASLAPSFPALALVLPLPLPMFLALFSSVSAMRSPLDCFSQ